MALVLATQSALPVGSHLRAERMAVQQHPTVKMLELREPMAMTILDDLRHDRDWPKDKFRFKDDRGEHDPCYVIMPGGATLPLNHHAGVGVDIARASFIVNACNVALLILENAESRKDDREAHCYDESFLKELVKRLLGKPARYYRTQAESDIRMTDAEADDYDRAERDTPRGHPANRSGKIVDV